MDFGTMMSDLLNRGWVFWMFALAFLMSVLGGRGGPPSSPSGQLSFDFMQEEARSREVSAKLKLKRFYPYATPFGPV